MNHILITGGAGFIGSSLAQLLLAKGCRVRVLDNLSPQIHGGMFAKPAWMHNTQVEFVQGSVTNRSDLRNALRDISEVVHLAAETGTGQSMYKINHYYRVNCQGTALLFDILANTRHHSVKRIVLASSRSVYGEGTYLCQNTDCDLTAPHRHYPAMRSADDLSIGKWDPVCAGCGHNLVATSTHEDDSTSPASIYAASKLAQEDLVRIGCQSQGIGFAILRLQNVYGEGQSLANPYTGILSIFSTRIRLGKELAVFEDGHETRDFVHVSDVARAIVSSLFSASPINTVVNVGSGIGTSIMQIAEQLNTALGQRSQIRISKEFRIGDIRHNFADITRLRTLLRCPPQVSIKAGLVSFCDWVNEQPLPEDKLAIANAELRARKLMG